MVDVDEIYRALGRPGRYQVCVYILLGFNYFPIVTNHLAMAFYGAKLPHHCSVSENTSIEAYIPGTYNPETNSTLYDSCTVYSNYSEGNETTACTGDTGWTYNTLYGERNIVNEFDLVCESAHLVSIATTIYFSGVMLGGLIFGSLSDRFGRKPFMLLTLYLHIVVGVAMAFANSYLLFVLIRFLQGILMQGLQTCTFVLAMELFTPAHRTTIGAGVELFWGAGVMWLALMAWLIRDWRYIQLAITLPSVVTVVYICLNLLFWGAGVMWLALMAWLIRDWRYIQLAITLPIVVTVVYIWLIPESIRWLIAQKKHKQAVEIIEKAARFNRVTVPEHLLNMKHEEHPLVAPREITVHVQNGHVDSHVVVSTELHTDKQLAALKAKGKTYSIVDMFKTRNLLKRSLLMFYLWFAIAVGYYGLSLSLSSLAGNKYFNVLIGGAVELLAYIIALFVLNRYGRRRPLVVYLFIGGVMCIIAGAIPTTTASGRDLGFVKTILAVLGRFGLAGGFSVIFLYTSELFPTVIRNVSIGACAFWMRVGGMLAPQILLLGQYTHKSLPIILLGCIALVGSGLTLLLPETLNQKLPDTVQEAEAITHNAPPRTKTLQS